MKSIIDNLLHEMSHQKGEFNSNKIPKVSLEEIETLLTLFKKALFPGVFHIIDQTETKPFLETILYQLKFKLTDCIEKYNHSEKQTIKITNNILSELPTLKKALSKDITAIFDGDPAAKGHEEVLIAYPSFEAIMGYRIAHLLSKHQLPLLARSCAGILHRKTGIDIHPSAQIGHHFCIDHGTGVVIGETAIIGNHVKMYQGVTIGALSVSKAQKNKKRHPTIEDNVTIYAGTTILGGETVVGKNSIIGGNVWLVKSVPENSKIMNKGYNIENT